MFIEKKMYPIWIGPKAAPIKWLNTWKEKHPDWNYYIFTDEMFKARRWKNQHLIDHYYRTEKWCGVSDLIRYELLYEEGGFIPEADMECLNNIEELLIAPEDHCYTCYEHEIGRPGFVQPFFASNPKNELLELIINKLHILKPTDLHSEPFRSTGNEFLSKMVPLKSDKVTIWPSHYFIPQFYIKDSPRYQGPDKIYAEHYWSSTGMHGKKYSEAI